MGCGSSKFVDGPPSPRSVATARGADSISPPATPNKSGAAPDDAVVVVTPLSLSQKVRSFSFTLTEERKKQLVHAGGDVVMFSLRFGLGFIPGAASILEVALPVAGFVMNRGKVMLVKRLNSKKGTSAEDAGGADEEGGAAPAAAEEDGAAPDTVDGAAAWLQGAKVLPREALAMLYEQKKLTAEQYESLLASLAEYEVEAANASLEAGAVAALTGDLGASAKELAEAVKGASDTESLQRKTEEVIKRRMRTCGVCGMPGVDRRSHKAGHTNAHLHDFSKDGPSTSVPASPQTPKAAAPLGATSSTGLPPGSGSCSMCGAPGVNAASHKLGHERAHLHDFSKDLSKTMSPK